MKRTFFQAAVRVDTAIWMHYMDVDMKKTEKQNNSKVTDLL